MEAAKIKIVPAAIYYLNEQSVTVEFGTEISETVLAKVNTCKDFIHANPFAGFITTIAAYASLTVVFNPLLLMQSDIPGDTCFEKVSTHLTSLSIDAKKPTDQTADNIIIPVCYNTDFGPDLQEVAQLHQLSISDVVAMHSSATYTVYMNGFVPGFAYLGGMDQVLSTPRKANPRKAVPAGSVGIAGQQTGIYPMQTPGGWQIIGQTPLNLFDVDRAQPSLLKAGDKVKFKPISLDEFNAIKADQ